MIDNDYREVDTEEKTEHPVSEEMKGQKPQTLRQRPEKS